MFRWVSCKCHYVFMLQLDFLWKKNKAQFTAQRKQVSHLASKTGRGIVLPGWRRQTRKGIESKTGANGQAFTAWKALRYVLKSVPLLICLPLPPGHERVQSRHSFYCSVCFLIQSSFSSAFIRAALEKKKISNQKHTASISTNWMNGKKSLISPVFVIGAGIVYLFAKLKLG